MHPMELDTMAHEGYTNYETFTIGLEIDNDEDQLEGWLNAARNTETTIELADRMKDAYEDKLPELKDPYSTLLSSAMAEVNWYELAEDKIEGFREQIKEGETSAGTLRMADIVEGIRELVPDELLNDFDLYEEDEPDDLNEMSEIFGDICDHMEEIAPEGLTFGASEGDGASFGFWKIEEE